MLFVAWRRTQSVVAREGAGLLNVARHLETATRLACHAGLCKEHLSLSKRVSMSDRWPRPLFQMEGVLQQSGTCIQRYLRASRAEFWKAGHSK